MAELIHSYTALVSGPDGTSYRAHAYGERNELGTWHGWLVFVPEGGGTARRTERETTQPERDDLVYWAGGVEPVYLEGALSRATETDV
jgi:hypothetical protein